MPVTFTMAAGDAPARIDMHGDIGWEVTLADVSRALKQAGTSPVSVSVNSFGGQAFEGIAIHNVLARHPGPVTVVVEGVAASAASIIAMAGSRIVMPDNAMMMIHRAAGLAWGTSSEARSVAEVLDKLDQVAAATYAARSGQTEADVLALMDAETWMTAAEANELGFATEVAPAAEVTMSATQFADKFRNIPPALRALAQAASPTSSAAAPAPAPPASPAATGAAPQPAVPATPTQEPSMNTPNPSPGAGAVAATAAAATLAQLDAIAARSSGVLGADWVLAQMRSGATEATAQAAALDAVAAHAAQLQAAADVNTRAANAPQLNLTPRTQPVNDPAMEAKRAAALESAMQHRAGMKVQLADGAAEFRGMSLAEIARYCLEQNGVATRGKTKAEIGRLALSRNFSMSTPGMSSSDFPNLLANTASKSLRMGYDLAPRTFLPFTSQKNLPDFKTFREVALSGAPQLAAVPESGAVSYGVIGEGAETWGLTRYGKATAITYVAIVNDDLSGFTRIPQMFGAEAGALENATVWGIITTNGNLADGGALFNATATTTTGGHANQISGASTNLSNDATGIGNVSSLQKLIRLQKAPTVAGVAGRPLNLQGRFLAIPSVYEGTALALFAQSVVPATTGAMNPWRSAFELIVEPLLDAASTTAFYLFADPSRIDTIHYGYLEGEAGPVITSNVDFETDGLSIKCMHNFGAKAIDFRGMAKSVGA